MKSSVIILRHNIEEERISIVEQRLVVKKQFC